MKWLRGLLVVVSCVGASCVVDPRSNGDAAANDGAIDSFVSRPEAATADLGPWVDGGGALGCAVPTRAPFVAPERRRSTTISGLWRRFDDRAWNEPSGACAIRNRADHTLAFAVTERATLQFTVTSRVLDGDAGATGPDLKLALRRQCDSSEGELACDLDSGIGANPAIRRTLEAGNYFLVLDGESIDGRIGVEYDVVVSNIEDDPRGTCAGAVPWTAGTVARSDTAYGSTTHTPCFAFGPTGPEVFLRYVLPPFTRSMLTVTPNGPGWSPVVLVRESCDSNTCASVGDSTNIATAVNGSPVERAYIVSVRAAELGTGGAFALSDTLSSLPPPPAGALCESAVAVGSNTTLTGQVASSSVDRRGSSCTRLTDAGREAFTYYRAVVPANHTLAVEVRPDAGSSARLMLFEGCSPTECLRSAAGSATLAATRGAYRNRSASEKVITIAVSSGSQSEARFDLDVRVLRPAMNTTCATAAPVSPSTPVFAANPIDSSALNPHADCEPSVAGNVLFYRLVVPARRAAFVRYVPFTPHAQAQGVLRVAEACDSRACVTTSRARAGMVVSNTSEVDREYIVTLGGDSRFGDVVAGLDVRVIAPATNASCAAPRAIADGETVAMQSSDLALDIRALSTCEVDSTGTLGYANQLYYQVLVPAGQTGVVRVRAAGGRPAMVNVFSSCSPSSCLASTASFAGRDAIARFVNGTMTSQTYLVAAGGGEQDAPTEFSVSYAVMQSPDNTSCANVRALSSMVPAFNQDQSAAIDANRLTSCMPTADGRVLYYSAAVPAGQGAVFTATPVGQGDIRSLLRLSDSCASTDCLASALREVSFTNTSASPRTIIATLGSPSSATSGPADVTVRLFAPRAYSTCAAATPLAPATTLAMQDTAAGSEQRWDGCSAMPTRGPISSLGPKMLYYSLTLAAGESARITLSSFTVGRASAVVFVGCSATACTNVDQSTLADRQITAWRNDSAAVQTYLVGVGSTDTLSSSQFTITRE